MRRARRADGSWRPLVLAGWLFADLAIALVVILLATATDHPAPAARPSPSASSASPSPKPVTRSVVKEPVTFTLKVDAGKLLAGDAGTARGLAERLGERLQSYVDGGRQAAIVLTFGVTGEPGRGTSIARAANKVLTGAFGTLMADAATRDFWTGGAEGTVEFEIYLFAEA